MIDLSSLNPEQREATTCTEGPLLVLAGAGSGKTRVLTHRVAYLLDLGIPPEHIVAVSFTNKAAGEMRERLAAMVGADTAAALHLSTFHSLGAQMMRTEPEAFGLPSARFSILDQGDALGLLRGLMAEYGLQGPDRRFDLSAVAQRIGLWKNDFVTPEAVRRKTHTDPYDEVAATLFAPYEERLEALGAVDFDDLVCRVARTLAHDDEVARRWTDRVHYIMVDEYQDTNAAQLAMVRHLAGARRNLCVVGDDDQAIYGWRGADIANILSFERHFPGARVIKLERNYRSRPPVLRAANATITHNKLRHNKVLRPTRRGGEPVSVVVAEDGPSESRWIGRKIHDLMAEQRVHGDRVAVLYRSSVQARAIEEELQSHQIAYQVLGGQSVYDKKEVKDALAYLQVLVGSSNEIALRRALGTPTRGIGPKTLARLTEHAKSTGHSVLHAALHSGTVPDLPGPARGSLERFAAHVTGARARARAAGGMAAGLAQLVDQVGLRAQILKDTGSEEATAARWAGVEWLVRSVERWERRARQNGGQPRWHEFVATLTLDPRAPADDDDKRRPAQLPGTVTLATLHSAKGLEWDYVFLIGCEDGRLPHKRVSAPRASDAIAGDIEEERRLFYVGITRAREQLWITRAEARSERGRLVPREPSRFLQELPDEVREHVIARDEQIATERLDAMADAFLKSLQPS